MDIEQTIKEYFKDNPKKSSRVPSVVHHTWEEDGQKYSSWTVDTGTNILRTGDGGIELFNKAMEKAINEMLSP